MAPETIVPPTDPQPSDPSSVDELEALHNLPSAERQEPVPADQLQDHFNMPSAEEPVYDQLGNQPKEKSSDQAKDDHKKDTNSDADSREGLAGKEALAGEAGGTIANSLYSHSGREFSNKGLSGLSNKLFVVHRRRTIAGGGLLGAIISIVLFFTLGSGPFQFVHIAQLLQQFHFSAQQDQSNDRSLQEFRWLRYKVSGNVERSNLGIFQNYIADKLEARMNTAGIESVYNNTIFGPNGDGVILTPSKAVGEKLGIQGQNEDQIKQFFKENYPDTEISFSNPNTGKAFGDGRFFVDESKLNSMVFTGRFKIASLNRDLLNASDINGIPSFLGARIMTDRAGATLHAITQEKVINKASELKFWEGWIDSTENGTSESINQDGDSVSDPNIIKEATDEVNTGESDIAIPASEGATPDVDGTNTEEGLSLKAKLTGGGLAALTVACTLKGLDSQATQFKEAHVVYPLMREATTMVAVGNQVMSGQDLTTGQLGFFNKLLDGPSTKNNSPNTQTSWYNAASIQAELGNANTGIKPSNTLMDINKNSPFHFLNTSLGLLLGTPCSILNSAVGQVVGIITAPVASALTYTVSQFGFVHHLYDDAALWVSGQPLNPLDRGADFGNDINYGARLAANAQAVSDGGRALSDSESSQLSLYESSQSQAEFQNHNLAYQLFNPYDDRSAISKLIDQQNPQPGQELHNVALSMLNFGHLFASIPKLFTATAHAATSTPYIYGFPEYGFSTDEMNNPLVRNPYQNADEVVNTILPEHSEYIQRAQDCFGVTIDPTTYNITSLGTNQVDTSSPNAISMNFFQEPGAAGYNQDCADSSSAWMQVRFYIFDTQTMASTTCFLGNDSDSQTQQACSDVGFDSSTPTAGSNPTPSGEVSLPTGSAQDLAKQLVPYVNDGKIKCASGDSIHNIDCSDITNTASGKSIAADSCQVDALNAGLLGMLLELVQMGHTFTLSALCSDHPTVDGLAGHNGGRAADFNTIDGTFMGGPTDVPWTQAKINAATKLDQDIASFMPKSTGFGQVGADSNGVTCHPTFGFLSAFDTFGDTCTHQHVQVEI